MKFSIIIPAYNAEDRIHKALDSIKSQTFQDYELIVICDSCKDKTEEIAKQYGAITKAVEYHADGLTRNAGLELAQGDYILFMDDDDWWLHECVLQQISDKLDSEDIDILCFSFIFRNLGYANPLGMQGQHWIAVWNKCWKRSVIGKTRFSGVRSGSADVQFHYGMMRKKNLKIVDWDMPMYYYNYLRPGSISERIRRR